MIVKSMIVKDCTKLERIIEDGKTYILNTDTGEKVQDWSDEVRARNTKKKPPLLETWKVGCVKYVNQERVYWKQCDARIDGKPCKAWEEVDKQSYHVKGKYRCYDCVENDRFFKKSPAKKAKKSPAKKAKK